MENKETVTLDFTTQKYLGQIFQEMREKMEWDDDYGENLSALWDILWGMPHKGDDFIILRPVRYKVIPHGQNDSFTEYVDQICDVFQKGQDEGYLTVKIQYTDDKPSNVSSYLI